MGTAYRLPIHPDQAESARGEQQFFYLDPPMDITEDSWDDDSAVIAFAPFVIVSAASVPFSGPETYIFPATFDGRIASYGELSGSYRGGLSIETALSNADYTVVHELPPAVAEQVAALQAVGASQQKEIEQ